MARKERRLPRDSVINVSRFITLDRSFLTERVGKLSSKHLVALDDGPRVVPSL